MTEILENAQLKCKEKKLKSAAIGGAANGDAYLNDVFGLFQNVFAGYGSFALIQTGRNLFRRISRIEIGCRFQ